MYQLWFQACVKGHMPPFPGEALWWPLATIYWANVYFGTFHFV